MKALDVFVPSNRKTKAGRPTGFVGLNELLNASKGSRFGKNAEQRLKFEAERHISPIVAEAMRQTGWDAPEGRCIVHLRYVEPNGIRDPDNVTGGGNKVVMDALCTPMYLGTDKSGKPRWRHFNGCSAIKDDGQRYVHLIAEVADHYDRENPGVHIHIETLD